MTESTCTESSDETLEAAGTAVASKTYAAHDLAALLAVLVAQPEALGCVLSDEAYEPLLADAAQLLTRHCGGVVDEVFPPEASGAPFQVRVMLRMEPTEGEGDLEVPAPDIDSLRGSVAAALRSLAERIR